MLCFIFKREYRKNYHIQYPNSTYPEDFECYEIHSIVEKCSELSKENKDVGVSDFSIQSIINCVFPWTKLKSNSQ